MITHLLVGFIKMILNEASLHKNESILFLNHLKILEEVFMLKMIFQTIQQKQISKIFPTSILQVLL